MVYTRCTQVQHFTDFGYLNVVGNGAQTEDRSWWPKDSHWETSGMFNGIWTPYQEHWFIERQEKISKAEAGPRNGAEWRNSLRGWKQPSIILSHLTAASDVFIDAYASKNSV